MPTDSASTNVLAKVIESNQVTSLWQRTNALEHILFTVALTFAVHGVVRLTRHVSEWLILRSHARKSEVANGSRNQFGEIILEPPALGQILIADPAGWNYLRVQLRIWPGQNALIETTFRQQVVASMKAFDPDYADWMVTVTYRAAFQPAETRAAGVPEEAVRSVQGALPKVNK
jgi:hypothetical protein